jgi:hypothetical protein
VRVVGAEFHERDDPSKTHDVDHNGLGLGLIDDVEHVEHLDHDVWTDGDRDAARDGVPDDVGRDHHDSGPAGIGLGQRACLGGLGGEPGGLQR